MSIMPRCGTREWTLTEAARLLGEPQHRLIYLCEKGVVQPDLEDASGRGSSRRFSAHNLLEFVIALRLRVLEIPAPSIGAITYTLRVFEHKVQQQIPDFCLPYSLRGAGAPDLRVIIKDGRLYLTLGTAKDTPKVYGGIDLKKLGTEKRSTADLQRALVLRTSSERKPGHGADGDLMEGSGARVELSITRIAQELRLEA
jgi:DNA-binding transcriptional MerR regulator